MTIEELCQLSGKELASLTDEQLLEFFKPFLNVTRPELAPKRQTQTRQSTIYISPERQKVLSFLEQNGIDVDHLRKKRK